MKARRCHWIAIAIGLGLGAGQVAITSICFVVLCILLILLSFKRKKQDLKGVFLDIENGRVNITEGDGKEELLWQYKQKMV